MKIIDGHRGESHITPSMVTAQNIGLFGKGLEILDVGSRLTVEKISAYGIRVKDGAFVFQGVRGVIEAGSFESIGFDEGEIGKKRIDIVVVKYEKDNATNIEQLSLVVKKGASVLSSETPTAPTPTVGDIQSGALIAEALLCTASFNQTTMTITENTSLLASVKELAVNVGVLTDFMGDLTATAAGMFQIPGGLLIQWGKATGISVPATGQVQVSVAYTRAFTSAPAIICEELGNYNIKANVENNTNLEKFNLNVRSMDGTARTDRSVTWLAVGYGG